MQAIHPNRNLIGVPGSLWTLETPALVLDLDALEANIALGAELARKHKVKLRPHAKSHKSAAIARLQMAAGAPGVCTQTIGEAEVLFGQGINSIHVAAELVLPGKIARLADLRKAGCNITTVVDDSVVVTNFAEAARNRGVKLELFVDVDPGRNKIGVREPAEALALARQIAASGSLSFGGIQAYAGYIQHVYPFDERKAADLQVQARIRAFVEALEVAGLKPPVVTGGGTGSVLFDGPSGLFNEIQVGSYVFMDVDYHRVRSEGASQLPFRNSLFVMTSVVSRNLAGRITTDGGIKSFATDGPQPEIIRGGPPGAVYQITGDEHGKVTVPEGGTVPALGQRLLCVVPHCDPNVNLYDWYHCCRGDRLVDLWPVDARGRSL